MKSLKCELEKLLVVPVFSNWVSFYHKSVPVSENCSRNSKSIKAIEIFFLSFSNVEFFPKTNEPVFFLFTCLH